MPVEVKPTIRVATVEDADRLSRLAARTFRETFAADNSAEDMAAYLAATFTPERQRRELVDPAQRVFLLEIEGTPVAYAHLTRSVPGWVSSRFTFTPPHALPALHFRHAPDDAFGAARGRRSRRVRTSNHGDHGADTGAGRSDAAARAGTRGRSRERSRDQLATTGRLDGSRDGDERAPRGA